MLLLLVSFCDAISSDEEEGVAEGIYWAIGGAIFFQAAATVASSSRLWSN